MQKGRHKKVRYIQKMPQTIQFSPRGKPGRPDEIELTVDQFEAIKLADFQGYEQIEGAAFMKVSRPTFGRILRQGRKVLADALVNSKIIRIAIGNVQVGIRNRILPHKADVLADGQGKELAIRRAILEYSGFNSRRKSPRAVKLLPRR